MSQLNDESKWLGQFIPTHYHYNMLLDDVRMQGFKAALDYAVKPDAKVVDLGGGTGVLSFFAARNASKVWCVERNHELVRIARRMLPQNKNGDRVEVVHADVFDYLPPEPVDVVVCEMLHVAMLCERQIEVIESFKRRYLANFGGPLPVFVPEACIQGVQPVQQDYSYEGYYAATILFQNPTAIQDRTISLADPVLYQVFCYADNLSMACKWQGTLVVSNEGILNALRFITKNVLVIRTDVGDTIDWHSAYLVMPIERPIQVHAGDQIHIGFSYTAGAELGALQPEVSVTLAASNQSTVVNG